MLAQYASSFVISNSVMYHKMLGVEVIRTQARHSGFTIFAVVVTSIQDFEFGCLLLVII